MIYRFTVWGDYPLPPTLPPGIMREGISVEIEAASYEKAVALLKETYENGKRPLVAGPADKWFSGSGETIVSMGMRRPDRTGEPS